MDTLSKAPHKPRQFPDRHEAGKELGRALLRFKSEHPIVLGLPRGGIPVAYEIARLLDAPLGVFIMRKIGIPCHREQAIGVIASGGIQVLNGPLIRELGVSLHAVDTAIMEELRELARRELQYGAGCAPPVVRGRTVILVDDGLATGATMRAAVQAVRQQHPFRVVVAAPVGARETVAMLEQEADEVVCITIADPFVAVGLWYAGFDQTTDEEVRELLASARPRDRMAS